MVAKKEVKTQTSHSVPVLYPGLTNEQEIYCNEVVQGKSYKDAFDVAYPNNNYSNRSKGVRISQINKNPKIVARVEELYKTVRMRLEDKTVYSFEDSVKSLRSLIQLAEKQIEENKLLKESQARIIISSIQELNKMFGYSTPKEGKDSQVNVVFLNSKNVKE